MSLKSELENALKDAMREKNEIKKRTLRLALASIKNLEIDKGIAAGDSIVQNILFKEIKNRKELIIDAQKANRDDLINEAETEINILTSFLPKGLTNIELEEIVKKAIIEVGAVAPSDMGKVMKIVMPLVSGRAPANDVSAMVSKLLSQKD